MRTWAGRDWSRPPATRRGNAGSAPPPLLSTCRSDSIHPGGLEQPGSRHATPPIHPGGRPATATIHLGLSEAVLPPLRSTRATRNPPRSRDHVAAAQSMHSPGVEDYRMSPDLLSTTLRSPKPSPPPASIPSLYSVEAVIRQNADCWDSAWHLIRTATKELVRTTRIPNLAE